MGKKKSINGKNSVPRNGSKYILELGITTNAELCVTIHQEKDRLSIMLGQRGKNIGSPYDTK